LDRSKKYPLLHVLFIAFAAVLAGAKGPTTMAAFAANKRAFFERFFPLKRAPSKIVFENVLGRLQPKAFREAFIPWAEALMAGLGRHLACDGKSVRGAFDEASPTSPLHLLHMWAVDERMLLGVAPVEGAPGELRGLEELLALIDVEGSILSFDANGCAQSTARQMVEAGGGYMLALKGNRGPMFKQVVELFEQLETQGELHKAGVWREQAQGHGRAETRVVHVVKADVLTPKARSAWAGLQALVRVTRTRERNGETSEEKSYYLTSMAPQASAIAQLIRGHWSVENQLHWVLDVTMGEDDCRVRNKTRAENIAVMRRMAVNRLGQADTGKQSMALKMFSAALNEEFLLQLLSPRPSPSRDKTARLDILALP
jgi:predicted transposase YbfD/YdcC